MSGTRSALRLIEQTSARLCHALGGPIDQLNHALSARSETGTDAANAAKTLTRQLRLWHAAWGPAGHPISLAQLTDLARGLPDPVAADLSALPPATVFPAPLGRIVLNLLLLAAESLPAGGEVVLAGVAEDLFVRIAGPEAAWPTGLALCIANEAEAHAALTEGRNLQMALTALLAHAAGIRLSALMASTTQIEPAILRLGG